MILRDLLSLFFPNVCAICGQPLVGDEHDLCSHCLLQLPEALNAEADDNLIERRFRGRLPYQAVTALLLFTRGNKTQRIIHQIKYYGHQQLAVAMGRQLGLRLAANPRFADVDLLIPVPLHRRKQRRRGYNQSLLICQGIAQTFPRPIVADNLRRTRFTRSQTHMNRQQRLDNMSGVFSLDDPAALQGRHLLLVDDVVTTGATTEACCQALLKAPATRVSIAALAISGDT